jgi:hypothetical protein
MAAEQKIVEYPCRGGITRTEVQNRTGGITSRTDRGIVIPDRQTAGLRALKQIRELEDAERVSGWAGCGAFASEAA